MKNLVCAFLALIWLHPHALVYTPRVTVSGQPDFYSLQTMVNSIIKDGMTPEQKAEAVWRFVLKYNFHYGSPSEGPPDTRIPHETNTLYDPVKLLNCYGYCYCFSNIAMMQRLWETAGFDSTKTGGIGGHLISEVYYKGGWHYYDGDQSVSTYCIKEDGKTAASIDEIQNNAEYYILKPKFRSNPSLPYDDNPVYVHESRKVLADYFATKDNNNLYRDRQSYSYHRMDYYLRKGESFTLYFDKQGKWRNNGVDFYYLDPLKGPYDVHGTRTYSNGLFEYAPDLRDSAVLSEGFYSNSNIKIGNGVILRDTARPGEFVIKVLSPYIITGTPVSPSVAAKKPVPYYGAAVVSGFLDTKGHQAVKMEILMATDNTEGEYLPVYSQEACGAFNVDLSQNLSTATYYYLLKIVLKYDKESPLLKDLALKTWVQVNPTTIPALSAGANAVKYSVAGPEVDKVDVERATLGKKVEAYPFSRDNILVSEKISRVYVQKDTLKPGAVVFELDSKEGDIFDYSFVALISMRENMDMTLYYSENDTLHWTKYPRKPKLHHDHWADWVYDTMTPKGKVTKVYFKAVLEGGASLVQLNYGYRYKYRPASGTAFAVHGVEVDGKPVQFREELKGAEGKYTVQVKGKKVVNRFLRYECK